MNQIDRKIRRAALILLFAIGGCGGTISPAGNAPSAPQTQKDNETPVAPFDPLESPATKRLLLQVEDFAGVTGADVTVLLVDDLAHCAQLDLAHLPAPTTKCATTQMTTTLGPYRNEVAFDCDTGVSYTAVATVRVDGVVAATGCVVTLQGGQRHHGVIRLYNRLLPPPPTTDLVVTNVFNQDLIEETLKELSDGLVRGDFAGRLEQNCSPAVQSFLTAHGDALSQAMKADTQLQLQDTKVEHLRTVIDSLDNARVITAMNMSAMPEYSLTPTPGQLEHGFHHFLFDIKNVDMQGFEVTRWFGSPGPLVTTEFEFLGRKATIPTHSLQLPLLEAVMGRLLLDVFGTSDYREAAQQVVDCPRIGTLTAQHDPAIEQALVAECQALVDAHAHQMTSRLDARGFGTSAVFKGSGNLTSIDSIISKMFGFWDSIPMKFDARVP